MRFLSTICILCFFVTLSSCNDEGDEALEIFSHTYDFTQGVNGWEAEFTDYPVNETVEADSVYRWKVDYVNAPVNDQPLALMLSCNNLSSDVFMFLKKKIDHLKPNTNYRLVYEIELSSNISSGTGLILKAGGSELEPKKVIENNYYTLNVDKGYYTDSGENLSSFGDVSGAGVVMKENTNAYQPLIVRSNSKGEIWLVVGTDSLIEGINSVYYTKINVIFSVSA